MKEKFEDRVLTGSIKKKLYEGYVWEERKENVVKWIHEVVNDFYHGQGYTLTLRQLYYQLVGKALIPNHLNVYKKIGTIKDDMCYSGVLDWAAFEDRGRKLYTPWWESSVLQSIKDAKKTYRVARQEGQKIHIEIWTEKEAISGILKPICSKYGISLMVNKGYSGSSAMYQSYARFASRLKSWRENKQKTIVLYFGDHDPSGLDMLRDIQERIDFMLENGSRLDPAYEPDFFRLFHMGLTKKQIEELNPPPNFAKLTDTRAKKYIAEHGTDSWEVDALKPAEIVAIVEEWVAKTVDLVQYEVMMQKEADDLENFQEIIDSLEDEDETEE